MAGFFAYLEYVVACWSLHLQEYSSSQPNGKALEEVGEEVEVFLGIHYQQQAQNLIVPSSIKEELSIFDHFVYTASFPKQLLGHANNSGPTANHQTEAEHTLDLLTLVQRVRRDLENSGASQLTAKQRISLNSLYGTPGLG